MHPVFHLKKLDQLTLPLRRIATAAAEEDCSEYDLQRFYVLTEDEYRDKKPLLPVFYIMLDPARVPAPADLDQSPLPLRVSCPVNLAITAFRGVSAVLESLPKSARVELWPRMMAWVRFLHTYYGFLRSSEECFAVDTTERKILNDFMFFTGKAFLTTSLNDISPAWNTEGFVLMLFRAWELSLGYYIEKGDPNFMTHCVLLVPEEYTLAQCEEAIEGSGGSLKHLARLLTRNLVLATPLLVKDFKHQLLVHRTCCAISGIDAALGVPGSNKPDHWPLMRAVMASDGVRELTNIFCVLADSGKTTRDIEGLWEEVVQKVVQVIGYAFFMGPEHVHPAIEAGFLVGVVDCGYGRIADSLFKRLEYLLSDLLSCMTIFLEVHDALVRAVVGIGKQRTSTEVFRNSRIFKAWRRFEGVLSMVGKMVMLFRARQATLRVCDNVRCGRMGERESFRKCAGCNMRVYCSRECQRADWKEGRHRDGCGTARYTRIAHRKVFSKQQLSFFRFILATYYTTLDADSDREMIKALVYLRPAVLRNDPATDTVPVTIFEFRGGPPTYQCVTTEPADTLRARSAIVQDDATFDEWVGRARRSNGRIALHAIHVHVGAGERWVVLPLRMNMSFMGDAAARLVKAIPRVGEDGDEYERLKKEFAAVKVPEKFNAVY